MNKKYNSTPSVIFQSKVKIKIKWYEIIALQIPPPQKVHKNVSLLTFILTTFKLANERTILYNFEV